MGNSQSTAQASRPNRSSNPTSPRSRTTPLPPQDSPRTAQGKTTTSSSADPRRRKKSIELSDVDTSLSFTQSHSGKLSAGSRKKLADRVGGEMLVGEDLDEIEVDGLAGGGTLRGAMQGKAEHVVYGPRRDASAPATPNVRPTTIALPSSTIPLQAPIADPDDTIHPGFKASPRLTSAVLLSQDRMPVLSSPVTEDAPISSPFGGPNHSGSGAITPALSRLKADTPTTSLSAAASSIFAPSDSPTTSSGPPSSGGPPSSTTSFLLPPTTSPPYPTTPVPPVDTVLAPEIPSDSLPISEADIPSGTSVLGSPVASPLPGATPTGVVPSPAVLLPPKLFNAPVAAIPIPLLSVPSATIAQSLLAAAVDLGAGADGVPTLIKWKNEDGQTKASEGRPATGPKEVFVTGTFAKGWKTKIELRKTDPSDFSALISLPPGPHRLKFIVDRAWKASKHLPVATDADGNLINYLQVNPANSKLAAGFWTAAGPSGPGTPNLVPGSVGSAGGTNTPVGGGAAGAQRSAPAMWTGFDDEELGGLAEGGEEEEEEWTQEIPPELVEWGEWEAERDALENESAISVPEGGEPSAPPKELPPPPASSGVPPPSLPAQLEKGPLNHAAYVTQGSGDDNSILPKPDHSVINHLAASPIKGGFLSVGVTTRYKRKFVTVVYYKALASRG
ncbi:hypothetical protein BCR35DRAFT_298931 [Leucosporidium creatinivorum]|uniref:Association with the SNF1 complex (ASC) domain-containing protein n=1 Tax=Leucosporidium creatinivorum TaxID=106004 RepID=A0A1Y2G4E5_9BASI|nr:hypothetical protein BCR35DRAFT_298931 [Leucosporidium creatinivorum]